MIRTSAIAKATAFMLSMCLVLGLVQFAWPEVEIEIAGGGRPVEARMGSAFEDMAEGVLTADAIDDAPLMPEPPVELAEQPNVEETQQSQATASLPPQLQKRAPVQQPSAAATPKVQPKDTPQAAPLNAVPASDAVLPMAVAPKPVETVQTPLTPGPPQIVDPAPKPLAPTNTIVAQEPDSTAPPLSIRPNRRDPEKAAEVAAARPKPTATPKPTHQARRGNAQQNNTQGAENGTNQQAKATSSGQGDRAAAQAGNAARDNYPGKVMRKIRRVGQTRVRARGAAVVSFSVAASGGLSDVSIARSSGSTALDQAALRVVRMAAPFPRPPSGAQRSFSVIIKGL